MLPESLFSDLLAMKEYNLLNLERELAVNVDIIILPLEGQGAIAELGAFASFPEIVGNIIVINEEKYKRKASFINLGPMKLVREKNKNNIVYFGDSEDERREVVDRIVKRVIYAKNRTQKNDVNNLFNLSRLILLIIAIFQPIKNNDLSTILWDWSRKLSIHYIAPCLKILVQNGRVLSDIQGGEKFYSLTPEGHDYVFEKVLPQHRVIVRFCQIRTEVINSKLSRSKRFNLEKTRERLLEL